MIALMSSVILATLLPARGWFADFVNMATVAAIMLLFFVQGTKLPRELVVRALGHWRLHIVIIACTFLFFPLLGIVLSKVLPGFLPAEMWTGILYLCAMPSTVQSSVAFTVLARGNVPAAIAAATASNLIGIVLTPFFVSLLVQSQGHAEMPLANAWKIVEMVLLPFILGQIARPWVGEWVARQKILTSVADRSGILLAVYSAFSAAVLAGIWDRTPASVLGMLLIVCCAMLGIAFGVTTLAGRIFGFDRADRITIFFAGSKKSVAMGVPMARVLFPGPEMGVMILPLIIYHQIQLMACAWIARREGERFDRSTSHEIEVRTRKVT